MALPPLQPATTPLPFLQQLRTSLNRIDWLNTFPLFIIYSAFFFSILISFTYFHSPSSFCLSILFPFFLLLSILSLANAHLFISSPTYYWNVNRPTSSKAPHFIRNCCTHCTPLFIFHLSNIFHLWLFFLFSLSLSLSLNYWIELWCPLVSTAHDVVHYRSIHHHFPLFLRTQQLRIKVFTAYTHKVGCFACSAVLRTWSIDSKWHVIKNPWPTFSRAMTS